jgi:hypothetical protein
MIVEDCVYIAYQGDVGEFQSVHVRSGVTNDEMIEKEIVGAMRACLTGWWLSSENKDLVDPSTVNGRFVCVLHGFVIRSTSSQWVVYQVDFTSDDLIEASVKEIEAGTDPSLMPTSLPNWMHGEGLQKAKNKSVLDEIYLASDRVRDMARFAANDHPLVLSAANELHELVCKAQSQE